MNKELQFKLQGTLIAWAETVTKRIRAKWVTIQGSDAFCGVEAMEIANMATVIIWGKGWKAWIAEFGSGHLLDQSNPYLPEYINSPFFNPERIPEGYEFIGREEGATVYEPDGSTYESSGKAHRRVWRNNSVGQYGLHLERPLNANHPGFVPQVPMHIMREEVEFAIPELLDAITVTVDSYVAEQVSLIPVIRIYV